MHVFHARTPTSRALAAIIATGGLLIGTLAAAPAATAAPSNAPTKQGADWLAGQVSGGVLNFGFDDYGLTIDAALALDSVGQQKKTVKKIKKRLAANINSYIAGDAFGDVGSTYAGATGKAGAFAGRIGADPISFGGVDLVTRLKGTISATAPIAGRIQDQSSFGDYANVIGQGFAVETLLREDPAAAKQALSFLAKQQCAKGYFRLNFNPDKTAADQTCDGGTATESAPDTDVTALVVLSLHAADTKKPKARAAIKQSTKWLKKQQANNGSFGGGPSTESANANSTGLAGWALAVSGEEKAAARAATWIRKLQAFSPKPCATSLTKDRGAIGYDKASYDAAVTAGVVPDQWTRATAQALPVLAWAKTTKGAPEVKAKKSTVKEGSKVKLRVTNLEPGERICVFSKKQASSTAVAYLSKKGRNATIKVATPSGTGKRVYRLKSMEGAAKVRVTVKSAA